MQAPRAAARWGEQPSRNTPPPHAPQDRAYDAFYRLTNPTQQIQAYVYDVIRSTIPTMKLDDAFEAKEEIAAAVKQSLTETMAAYGFIIHQALVTDLQPDGRVKDAMNQVGGRLRRMNEGVGCCKSFRRLKGA